MMMLRREIMGGSTLISTPSHVILSHEVLWAEKHRVSPLTIATVRDLEKQHALWDNFRNL